MSSHYGENLKLTVFGQSHGKAIGMTLDGIPAGLTVDFDKLQLFLNRRAPGQNSWSTSRKEEDSPDFLSGIVNGKTCGAPISAVIYNHNIRSSDYENISDCPRPGHSDYTAHIKYGGFQDAAGGGHFSGRLTAPMCIAGGLCSQWLAAMGIQITAHIAQIGTVKDDLFDPVSPEAHRLLPDFPVFSQETENAMKAEIEAARQSGDSVGGIIECAVSGLPAGLGDPMFGGVESKIAQIVYGIPAVKGLEFGAGFQAASMRGSIHNDSFRMEQNRIITQTNHAGGILGGISTGMPVIFRAAVKPTPSIAVTQQTVSLAEARNTEITVQGRHDPCIVPRAVCVMEAAAAIAVYDMILARRKEQWI